MSIAVLAVCLGVWSVVAYRAWRYHADVVMLALVLIVMGLLGTQLFETLGFEAPGSFAFTVAGVLLLLLWPRDRA